MATKVKSIEELIQDGTPGKHACIDALVKRAIGGNPVVVTCYNDEFLVNMMKDARQAIREKNEKFTQIGTTLYIPNKGKLTFVR